MPLGMTIIVLKYSNVKPDFPDITFDVDDIDETFTLLKNEGFSIVEDRPVYLPFWENRCKYFNILGPDGERLEFCQIL
jgi:hypothetical protein